MGVPCRAAACCAFTCRMVCSGTISSSSFSCEGLYPGHVAQPCRPSRHLLVHTGLVKLEEAQQTLLPKLILSFSGVPTTLKLLSIAGSADNPLTVRSERCESSMVRLEIVTKGDQLCKA